MRRFSGSCRFVFNRALALQRARYEAGEKHLGYGGLCRELTAWRNDPGRLACHRAAAQHQPHLPRVRPRRRS